MTNNLIKQFLDEHDYDVRKTHNGRWIDQKCIYDEVCFVSDCIVDYLLNGGKEPFTSPLIWHQYYSIKNVMHVFGKPDPTTDTVIDEYNKFFRQPMKMLAAAGILKEEKKGITIYFSVENRDMLEHIALRERNAFDFMCLYIEKVLKDSGIWDPFASFFDEQTNEQYDNLKARFSEFCIENTPIGTEVEANRIFTTILNQLACNYHKKGTARGKMSKTIITLDKIAYNKPNWYDNLTGKEKNVSRRDFSEMDESTVADNTYDYMVTRAMRNLRDFIERYYNNEPEVIDRYSIGQKQSAIHHIFPKSSFPRIAMYIENLIALTSAQHLQEAHPGGNTRKIDKDFQYTCLICKADRIKKNIEGELGIPVKYSFSDFMFVLDVGLSTDYFEQLEENDFNAVLAGIEANYS